MAPLLAGNPAINVIVNPNTLVEFKPMLEARYNVPFAKELNFKEANYHFFVAVTPDLELITDLGGAGTNDACHVISRVLKLSLIDLLANRVT